MSGVLAAKVARINVVTAVRSERLLRVWERRAAGYPQWLPGNAACNIVIKDFVNKTMKCSVA